MDNQVIFIIILGIVFLYLTNTFSYSEKFISKFILASNIIDCSKYTNSKDCDGGYKCTWINEKLKAYPLNTPYCTGNILDVPVIPDKFT